MTRGPLDPEAVAPLLGAAAARWHLTGGGPTMSTMLDARDLADAGDPGPVVALASSQTGGRGRFERAWGSPEGGVYFTALVRPGLTPESVAALPLVAGLGIAQCLDSDLGVALTLKWPNDIRAAAPGSAPGTEPGKVAGILMETAVSGDRLAWVTIGVGINVLRPQADAAAPSRRAPASSAGGTLEAAASSAPVYLAELVTPVPSVTAVAAAAITGLAGALERFEAHGFGPFAAAYAARSDIIGTEVTVRDAWGHALASGIVTGIDPSGCLLMLSEGRERAVAAGEVTLRG